MDLGLVFDLGWLIVFGFVAGFGLVVCWVVWVFELGFALAGFWLF